MAQTVKNLPAVQETWVQSLGQENALEEEMATHSRILDEKSYGQRSLADYSPWDCKESDMTEWEHGMETHPLQKATCSPVGT